MAPEFPMHNDDPRQTIQEEKQALRLAMRRRLAALDPAARRTANEAILDRLLALDAWRAARCVLLFAPTPSEPDVDLLWQDGRLKGKECVYPVVAGDNLRLCRVTQSEELRAVPPWGLREPVVSPESKVQLTDLNLLLVPGLAFDNRGGRLGRGGGFYDRLLALRADGKPIAIGVGFACQRVEALPLAPHDVLLDAVLLC